jgi:predicted O-linked N-acetylglucosamine transferase (SPINDLY family)
MNPQLQIMLQQAIQAFQSGNYERADSILVKVIKADSKNLPAFHILGLIKASQKKYKEAIELLGKAVKLDPNEPSLRFNLAKALMDSGAYMESIPHHKKAVELAPNNPEAWLNYGKAFSDLNAYEEALSIYDKALIINPGYAEAFLNKGATLKELKRYEEAIVCAESALRINPNLAEGWVNKGVVLKEFKRYEEVISHYEKALSLKSEIDWLNGELLHTKMKICRWSGFTDNLENITNRLMANEKIANPFPLLALTDGVSLQRKCAEIYAQEKYPFNPALGPITKTKRLEGEKIRIGYFSADFHNHATGYLMAELFELHDKQKFEIFGFSFGPIKNDEIRQRLEKSFNQFIEVGDKADVEISQLSRDLNIDIAVDLKGFTQDARMGIFSYRAAPIQVNYLGYPGTLGADYMDYIIADETLIPDHLQLGYSEKVVYLPDSYQANDSKRVIADKKFTRQELGLPETGFVFSSFNNNYKILPAIFDSWMRILNAAEGSVLWLFEDNNFATESLKNEAEKRGIDSNRLVFAKRMSLPEHLARHQQADLFLDTFPYNAHTTASDALWAGLPIITLMGESFASRVAASLLYAINLPELVTTSRAEYELLAIELAANPLKLNSIKQKLTKNRLTTPLFNAQLFTKNLEATYMQMYERDMADLPPEHITII